MQRPNLAPRAWVAGLLLRLRRRWADRLRRSAARVGALLRSPRDRFELFRWLLAVGVMGGMCFAVVGPILSDFHTYGFHDWDVATSYRYITVLSIKRYFEAPFWHPWLCGGFPAFGHPEGATNFVSPYLPLYLLTDIRTAIRVEVVASALVGLAGSYLLAGRFTRSIALKTFVAIIFVLNGRWALQAAVGHTWHLQYAWLPWVLWLFDRSLQPRALSRAIWAGALIALMIYAGGIYPVPHTVLVLCLYALLMSVLSLRLRPIVALAISGVTAFGFAAPKLFTILDAMQRAPRLIESKETIGLAELIVMMTAPNQSYGLPPVRTPAYGWHEWGIYVGPVVLACLMLALLFSSGRRENALKLIGALLLLLGFGDFHENSPWGWLHKLPLFASLHVPSRFHYPMVLVLGVCFASWATRFVERSRRMSGWLDAALLAGVAWIASDIAQVSRRPFAEAFWMEKPDKIEVAEPFEHRTRANINYKRRDWAAPVLLSMFANTGLIECYGVDPGFKSIGARGVDDPRYRGRAYFAQGSGEATLVQWSPNRAVVEVKGATEGALLVYNMNYDPSWRADGKPALDQEHAVAMRVNAGDRSVVFSYFPRTLKWSVPLFFVTLGLCIAIPWWWRRREGGRVRATPSDPPGF